MQITLLLITGFSLIIDILLQNWNRFHNALFQNWNSISATLCFLLIRKLSSYHILVQRQAFISLLLDPSLKPSQTSAANLPSTKTIARIALHHFIYCSSRCINGRNFSVLPCRLLRCYLKLQTLGNKDCEQLTGSKSWLGRKFQMKHLPDHPASQARGRNFGACFQSIF